MLTTIKGYYDHGQIILSEQPPVIDKDEVIITFLNAKSPAEEMPKKRKFGGLKGLLTIPDDFNEPLDDLKDYM